MRFSSGFRTDVGRGRPENEDRYLVDPAHGLYAVADGMGGHKAGEVASAIAIETLRSAYDGGRPLDEAVEAANAAVFAKAADDPAMRGMGTTMTALALQDDRTAVFGHVGDSRAYLLRNGSVTQVTDDHSLVEQLVREGRLTPEEAQHHPQRAIITRALGVDADVEVDTYRVDLSPGDRLLICSDGLTNMLSDDTIAATLRRYRDPQQAADTLVDLANQAGGDDNITVVVLDALGDAAAEGQTASTMLGAPAKEEPTGEWRLVDGVAEPAPVDGLPATDTAIDTAIDAATATATVDDTGEGDRGHRGDEGDGTAPAGRRPRRRTGRGRLRAVLLWGLPILIVVAVAFGAVGWYARRTYFVGLADDRVTLFKGVPGGLLGWQPTIEEETTLTGEDLTQADRDDLEGGHRFSNRGDATRFLALLEQGRQGPTAPAESSTGTGSTGSGPTGPNSSGPGETTR